MRVTSIMPSGALFQAIILMSLTLTANSCSWTPQVRTPLYETKEGSVSLITASDANFQASHPAELSSQTIVRILQGLYIQHHSGILQGLLAGPPSKDRLFSEAQISWLAPILQKAFSQVTPEELVNFQVAGSPSSKLDPINGMMFMEGNNFVVSVNWRTLGTGKSSKPKQGANSRNPTGILADSLVFMPEDAVRKNISRSWLTGPDEPNRLVLDYKMLAGDQPNGSLTPATPQGSTASAESKTSPLSPESSPPQEQMSRVPPPSPTQPMSDSPDHPADQNLLEEIKALKQKLEAQQAEINELKKR